MPLVRAARYCASSAVAEALVLDPQQRRVGRPGRRQVVVADPLHADSRARSPPSAATARPAATPRSTAISNSAGSTVSPLRAAGRLVARVFATSAQRLHGKPPGINPQLSRPATAPP